jgi:SLOG in TRPM, prokaryote/Protein of unknown function (DUF4231)
VEESPTAALAGSTPRKVRVASEADVPARLAEVGLRGPRPVVVLVGGADGIDQAHLAGLRAVFEEGLVPVVDALGACVVDGGTDAGAMALVGQARAKLGATFPLVGVAAGGTVDATGGPTAAPPEPHHSHLVLVPGANWGDESSYMSAVATELAGGGPSVTVVVNGGELTFGDAERSVEANRPVLVVAGSGRAADAMAAALRGERSDKRTRALAASGLLRAVDLDDGAHELAREVAAALTSGQPAASSTASRQDWLKADLGRLIGELGLPTLRRHSLRSRWLDQVLWVEQRATHNRDRYYLWRLVTIIGGVVVPALVTLNLTGTAGTGVRWATFAVSLLVAVSAAVEGFFRYGERWRHYRRTAELLKSEGWQFFQLTGPYRRHHTHAAAYPLFAGRVEGILDQDVDAYVTTVVSEPAGRQPDEQDDSAPA